MKAKKTSKENIVNIQKGEQLLINVGSSSRGGEVVKIEKDSVICFKLKAPVCAEVGEIIAISRRIDSSFR